MEGKNGVLIYKDYLEVVDELEDDEAGRLFKHLLRYVNDLNPEAPDRLTKLLFANWKEQLKRDLKKWEVTKDKKSDAGALGNLKRWNLTLYNDVVKNKITLEEALIIAQNRKVSHSDKSDKNNSTAKKTVAKIAVNVNVNETVNVSDSVIQKEEEKGVCDFPEPEYITFDEGFGYSPEIEEKPRERRWDLVDALVKHFGFEEMRFEHNKRQVIDFVSVICSRGEKEHFKLQFQNYYNYKALSGEKVHNFTTMIGRQENQYLDGAWNSQNWEQKVTDLSNSPSKSDVKFQQSVDIFNSVINPHGNSEV